jgi:hypothetical protein
LNFENDVKNWQTFITKIIETTKKLKKEMERERFNKRTQHLMHKVPSNYSSCTSRSSENLCSRSASAQAKKGKAGQNRQTQFRTKSGVFLSFK